jgi:hypothetical protein
MKKILMSFSTLIIALFLIFAATKAVWTHKTSVLGNKISTGSTDIKINNNKEATKDSDGWNSSDENSNFKLSDFIPGDNKKDYAFSLWNNSSASIDFNLSGIITNLNFDDNPDKTKLLVNVYDYDNPTDQSGLISLDKWLSSEQDLKIQLKNDEIKKFGIEVQLDSSARDDWQGQNVNFDLKIVGTQK